MLKIFYVQVIIAGIFEWLQLIVINSYWYLEKIWHYIKKHIMINFSLLHRIIMKSNLF